MRASLRSRWLALLVVLGLARASPRACGGTTTTATDGPAAPARATTSTSTQGSDLTIAMVTHGDGGSFWAVAKKGAEEAAKDLGVNAEVHRVQQRPAEAGAADRGRGHREGRRPRGLGARTPTPSRARCEGPRRRHPDHHAQLGRRRYQELGAITHVGQTESDRRRGAPARAQGGRRQEAAVRHPRAGQHRPQRALRRRQEGLRRRRREPPGQGHRRHRRRRSTEIQSKLQADKSIDASWRSTRTSRSPRATPIKGASSDAKLATFDLSGDVMKGIKAGEIAVRGRPAAVPAGLPAGRVPDALQARTPTPSAAACRCSPGPGFVDQGQRRHGRAARGGRHALTLTAAAARRPAAALLEEVT